MKTNSFSISKRYTLIISTIVLIAIVLSLASLVSYNYTASNITNTAINAIHSSSQAQVSDLSNLIAGKLELVTDNLAMISDTPAVALQNVSAAQILFEEAQNSTKNLTYDYTWINADGIALTSANLSNIATIQIENLTFEQSPYFLGAKNSGALYYSTGQVSIVSHLPTIYIAQPLYVNGTVNGQSNKVFNGIVFASINLPSIGQYVESQISSHSQSSVGLVDPSGIVLFTANQSLIGTSIFGSEFQSTLPTSMKQPFNSMLNQSLEGKSGISDFSYNGTSGTIVCQPIFVPDPNEADSHEFAILFVSHPDVLAITQSSEIAFLGEATAFTITGIIVASLVASIIVLRWNRRLDERVKEKTAELVSLNSQLEEQNKAQKDLINIAAHELRTPTQTILTTAEIMADLLPPTELSKASSVPSRSNPPSLQDYNSSNRQEEPLVSDLRGLVESTHRNAKRLAVLTQRILEVAKIDNKGLKLDLQDFDLNEIIKEAIDDVRASFSSNNLGVNVSKISIRFEPATPTLFIAADKTKVYEVISNILRNALEHSRGSAEGIVISLEKSADQVIVKVRDDGGGIDPDILPRLFNKFVTKMGTGLGLYISKSYVEAHGGKIWAENNSDGHGSTFYFSIPTEATKPLILSKSTLN